MGQVFVPDELMVEATKQGLDLEQEVVSFLRGRLRSYDHGAWLAENREAIEAYNQRIDRDGLLLDDHRLF